MIRPIRILVVEDDRGDIQLFKELLIEHLLSNEIKEGRGLAIV